MALVGAEERIVRALCDDKFDEVRISRSFMAGPNTSVSRLTIVSWADHWEMFRKHVQRPDVRTLKLIAEIQVGTLQAIGQTREPPKEITVVEKPEEWNPAHAEIEQSFSKGLQNAVIPAMLYRTEDGRQFIEGQGYVPFP